MHIHVKGLVVKETSIGECNRSLSLLTDKIGLIKVLAKGAKSIKSKNACASQIFSYSNLTLYKGQSGYIINEAEVVEVFNGLRKDIYNLSMGQYFCEVMLCMAPREESANDYLRLILNSFAYLDCGKIRKELIKSIFEMRMCTMSGYMPDLTGCRSCGQYKTKKMYFSIDNAILMCEDCLNGGNKGYILLENGVLEALRHINYSPIEKLFSFRISDKAILNLSNITERYMLSRSWNKYKALDFYKLLNG